MLYSEFQLFGFRSDASGERSVCQIRMAARYLRQRTSRKRCSTRLLPSAHTARPSRRLLSTTAPSSRRAGHAVCLRLRWLERLFGFGSSASVANSSILSPALSDSLTGLCLSVFCSSMRRGNFSLRKICIRESRPSSSAFQIVAESLSTSEMTPNHALQRTAPHVTAPASTAALPPTMQVPRRAPRSLSLRSLGASARIL